MTSCRPNPIRRRKPNSGEKNGQARLTEGQVVAIRRARAGLRPGQRMRKDDPRSIASIAARFGVSSGHVSRIVLGFQWGHL